VRSLSAACLLAATAGGVLTTAGGVPAAADPGTAAGPHTALGPHTRTNAEAVQKAMQDELARSMAELHLGDEPRPYYVAYTVSDFDQATVGATLGAITAAHAYRGRLLRTDMRVGDPSFDNTNFEGGPRVETIPLEDDYAALRRELWLRTDEAYKTAIETLARKRGAAAGQASAEEDETVGDFSKEPAAHVEVPFPSAAADPEALRGTVRRLSALLGEFPQIYASHVTGSLVIVRRRLASSDGSWVDDHKRTLRIDVVADTQADDGMKLRSFVPFTASDPGGLPPAAEMDKAVRAMARELCAMRTAPVAISGAGAVLFEGAAAPQLVRILLGDQLGGTPPPKTASAGSDEGGQQSALASKLGQKVAAPILAATDDPLLEVGPGKTPLFGAYRVDDEGVPAHRVALVEKGVLKALLMSRTPRKEIEHSNGHARAPRFAGARAHVGTLIVTGAHGLGRPALLDELAKIAKGGGVTTYVVRLLDDGSLPGSEVEDLSAMLSFGNGAHGPPPIRPLVVYRVVHGKETLVRGLSLENLLPRSLKDVTAVGNDPAVYNYLDGGGGFSGIPSTVISPSLLLSDVDVRRQTGKHRKPPVYPSPLAAGPGAPAASATASPSASPSASPAASPPAGRAPSSPQLPAAGH
jgi:predicted Zn-dependent protease